MKIFSISSFVLSIFLIGTLTHPSEFLLNGTPTKSELTSKTVIHLKPISPLINKLTSKKTFVNPWSGSWSSSGYHSYGSYTIDLTGLPTNTDVYVSYDAHTVPNRFYVQDDCSLGVWNVSGPKDSFGNPIQNGWVGYSTNPGPWGYSGISISASGQIHIKKLSGCDTYTLTVETSVNSTTDYWTSSY